MIKLCIFDMDGTIVNSLGSISWFANQSLIRHGLPPFPQEAYKQMVGNGAAKLVQRMIRGCGGTEEQYHSVLQDYNSTYDADPLYLAAPYDGIPEMLKQLRSMGSAIAVLSNKPHSTTCSIAQALFGDQIDACLGGRADVPLKPAPDGVFELLRQFNVTPDECLYIGDTGTDMQTAENAGLFSVGVTWGFRPESELRAANACAIISSPAELVEIARHLNKKDT